MPASAVMPTERHCQVHIQGIVQGVGFRPFVYRLAHEFNLSGDVLNDARGVTIRFQGERQAVEQCLTHLTASPPPLARIDKVRITELDNVIGRRGDFVILASAVLPDEGSEQTAAVALSPDVATCPDCSADIKNPNSRFYRYPFTNCTNCGPRYSIIRQLPYDRPFTSMAQFAMCPQCQTDYQDPANRRYHAQPISCPQCGPQLSFRSATGERLSYAEAALVAAIVAIDQGQIIAVKGLGGFHLLCDATNEQAVARLRQRKHRPRKPFAVIVPDESSARKIVTGNDMQWQQLLSPQRPIVLLHKQPKPILALAPNLAPGMDCLGLFLPYTPLHLLLLEGLGKPVVATSANISSEPIITDGQEIVARLSQVIDGVLDHDRAIVHAAEDSVVQVIDDQPMLLRAGRGFAPLTLTLSTPVSCPTLAVGAQQKNSFAFAFGRQVIVSPYLGDLHSVASEQHFRQTCASLLQMYRVKPRVIAHDLHPDYVSTRFARELLPELGIPEQAIQERAGKQVPVQHHYAHVLSQLALNNSVATVLGFAFDGTGLGDDGDIWGSEAFMASPHSYQRIASLKPFTLIGADSAVQDPTRLLLALLFERHSVQEIIAMNLPALQTVDPIWLNNVHRLWLSGASCLQTSSAGRLFDAVARLLGLIDSSPFEGEAGMRLASAAETSINQDDLHFELPLRQYDDRQLWDTLAVWQQVVEATLAQPLTAYRISVIAAAFIEALANAIAALAAHWTQEQQQLATTHVALCGGVFQNRLLYSLCQRKLNQQGLQVLPNYPLPINDGGIALGQLWYAIHNSYSTDCSTQETADPPPA